MSTVPTLYYCHVPIATCCETQLAGELHGCYADYAGEEVVQWAEKFNVAHRKHQFLSIWGFVRLQLAKAMQVPFDQIRFARTTHNKPYILNADLQPWVFNLSHTKDHLVLCYGKGVQACGIDMEQPRPMDDMAAIVERFYAPAEARYFASLPTQQDQVDYFYRLWVIKEAVLKASGLGIALGLQHVDLGALPAPTKQGMVHLNHADQVQRYYWQLVYVPTLPYPMAMAATEPFCHQCQC